MLLIQHSLPRFDHLRIQLLCLLETSLMVICGGKLKVEHGSQRIKLLLTEQSLPCIDHLQLELLRLLIMRRTYTSSNSNVRGHYIQRVRHVSHVCVNMCLNFFTLCIRQLCALLLAINFAFCHTSRHYSVSFLHLGILCYPDHISKTQQLIVSCIDKQVAMREHKPDNPTQSYLALPSSI